MVLSSENRLVNAIKCQERWILTYSFCIV